MSRTPAAQEIRTPENTEPTYGQRCGVKRFDCRRCHGDGELMSAKAVLAPSGIGHHWHQTVKECPVCDGTGFDSSAEALTEATAGGA